MNRISDILLADWNANMERIDRAFLPEAGNMTSMKLVGDRDLHCNDGIDYLLDLLLPMR